MIGEVTITKIYKDGTREVVLNKDRNMVTDGLGISLVNMFTLNPQNPRYILDNFKLGYFQVGTSGVVSKGLIKGEFDKWESTMEDSTGNNFYELSAPLTVAEYGQDTTLKPTEKKILTVTNPFEDAIDLNYVYEDATLVEFEYDPVVRLVDGAVHAKIHLDENSCNGQDISELGLFIKNPEVFESRDRPCLAAYKTLFYPIEKSEEFSVDIDWVLHFSDENLAYRGKADSKYIYFAPSAKFDRVGSSAFVKYLTTAQSYEIAVETPIPVEEDSYLYYDLGGDAVSGTHYVIDSGSSPILFEKGSSRKKIKFRVNRISNIDYHSPKIASLKLSSFTGQREIPNPLKVEFSNEFLVHLQASSTFKPPVVELITPTATLATDQTLEVSAHITYNNGVNLELAEDIQVYLDLSSESGRDLATSAAVLTISAGDTSGTFSIDTTGTGDVTVSTYNTLSAASYYNKIAHSNDFRFIRQLSSTDIDPNLLFEHKNSFIPQDGSGFYTERFSPWATKYVWFAGDPTLKVHSNNDVWTAFPPLDVFTQVSSLEASAPDGQQPAQLCYTPCSLYAWHRGKNGAAEIYGAASKIRKDYTSDNPNGRNVSPDGPSQKQTFEWTTDGSSIAFSVYVKNIPDSGITHKGTPVKPAAAFTINIFSRGMLGVPREDALSISSKGKSATFAWDPNGGLYLSAVNADGLWVNNSNTSDAGVFSGVGYDTANGMPYDDRWASVEDGWYRAYITALVDKDFTNEGIYAPLSLDGSGATSQFFIHYNVDAGGSLARLPGERDGSFDRNTAVTGTDIPVDMSGCYLAWGQWEYGITQEASPYTNYPREYQANSNSVFTPLGQCVIRSGNEKVTFTSP